MSEATGPLKGLKVFDLTRVLAGPTCVQMLADLGADVIKIEKPGSGDDTRGFAPPFMPGTKESAYFVGVNRNKRSVTLDIAQKEGQAIAVKLIAQSDILAENFKVGALAKYGLGYAQLKERFPGLIYCSITGFGQTGPYAARPGYDSLIQAMGGVMSLTGDPDGAPQKVGVPLADLFAGLYGCIGILAALRHREATGQGQQIDIGMLDTHLAWLANQGMNYLATGENPARLGNQHPNIVPYQVFATSDGFIVLSIGNDPTFRRFCKEFGLESLISDARFATNGARVENRAAGHRHIGAGVETREDGLVGGAARSAANRLRPDQHVEGSVRRSPGAGARRRRQDAAFGDAGWRQGHRQSGAALGNAGRLSPAAATARRAYRRRAATASGHGRRRDRRTAPQGRRLSGRGRRSAPRLRWCEMHILFFGG